jgi:hypothetical protein
MVTVVDNRHPFWQNEKEVAPGSKDTGPSKHTMPITKLALFKQLWFTAAAGSGNFLVSSVTAQS